MGAADGSGAVQRWRLLLRRAAGDVTQRDHEAGWEAALEASGLPCASGSARRAPRITFAVPLPVGVAGEAEPAEILLAERRRSVEVREALARVLPAGTELRDLHDVWLGEPGLPSLVVAADYRIELAPAVDPAAVRSAIAGLLAAAALPRVRGGDRRYDLRPLIASLSLGDDPIVLCRLRHDPAAGTGRPDELLLALGDRLGGPVPVRSIVRERVVLVGE